MSGNNAPEKIWAVEGLCEILSFNTYDNGGPSYTRTDLHLALVAAEREACSVTTEEDRDSIVEAGYVRYRAHQRGGARGQTVTEWDGIESHIIQAYSDHIRARTYADAQAALERVKREARNEALREAAEVAKKAQLKRAEGTVGGVIEQTRANIANTILALMEDTNDGDS